MNYEFKKFFESFELSSDSVILVPYGSRVYGTNQPDSDEDFIAVLMNNNGLTGQEWRGNKIDITLYDAKDFQNQLNLHKIHALEAFFHPDGVLLEIFKFSLNLPMLRKSISSKSSHSWVKAKKKMIIEKDRNFVIAFKSLFHSFRILDFGYQIATKGKIVDFSSSNYIWEEIISCNQYNWDYYMKVFKPRFNKMSTRFRKVAPKQ